MWWTWAFAAGAEGAETEVAAVVEIEIGVEAAVEVGPAAGVPSLLMTRLVFGSEMDVAGLGSRGRVQGFVEGARSVAGSTRRCLASLSRPSWVHLSVSGVS